MYTLVIDQRKLRLQAYRYYAQDGTNDQVGIEVGEAILDNKFWGGVLKMLRKQLRHHGYLDIRFGRLPVHPLEQTPLGLIRISGEDPDYLDPKLRKVFNNILALIGYYYIDSQIQGNCAVKVIINTNHNNQQKGEEK